MQSKDQKPNQDKIQRRNLEWYAKRQPAKTQSTPKYPGVGQLRYDPFAFPLPEGFQTQAEEVLQTDLSEVKIKESEQASDLGALAYTQGNEITFAPGQFNPDTQSGKELIGHELAHVKQQQEGRVQATTQAKGIAINDDPSLEQEADRLGKQIAQTETGASSSIQKKPKTLCTHQPMQMKKYYRKFGSDNFEWDNSYFDVKAKALIKPEDYDKQISTPVLDTEPYNLANQNLTKGNSTKGIIKMQNKFEVFKDAWYAYEKTSNGVIYSTYQYDIKDNGKILLQKLGKDNTAEKIHVFDDLYVIADSTGTEGNILFTALVLYKAPTNVNEGKTQKDEYHNKSTSKTDFESGLGINPKVHIHLEANGNDILMLLGGRLFFKGKLQDALKNFPELKKYLDELLKKQTLELDLNADLKLKFSHIYDYFGESTKDIIETEKISRSYTMHGEIVKEANTVTLKEILKAFYNVFFENENQHVLSEGAKSELDAFLKRDDTKSLLRMVQNGQYLIKLEGHASSSASQEYNEGIANKRIVAIKEYMLLKTQKDYGLVPQHFTKANMGKSQADATVITIGDRRVLISFVKK